MQKILESIENLVESNTQFIVKSVEKIPESGSDRIYFRVITNEPIFIATYNKNTTENNTFINFASHFKTAKAPVPEVFFKSEDSSIYIQEDLGNTSLLNVLESEGHSPRVYELFKKALFQLANLQIEGDKNLNYDWCITSKEFGKQALLSDLLYFKYYFADFSKIAYDKEKLGDDFDALSNYLSRVDFRHFMFRDFQSRNIMIKNEEVHFIDFQGGMKGALQYDVASLLWQAKAELSDDWKDSLLNFYIECIEHKLDKEIDKERYISQYNGYVLIRLLQVLGAYGLKGIFERKAHFLSSIPLALRNLKSFLNTRKIGLSLPEVEKLLMALVSDKEISKYEPLKATPETPLLVRITSFSYKKTGYPKDETENGGGYVFDCRGILNPGRIDEYKQLTGRDKPVKDYLEQYTSMKEFLNNAYNTVDISVEDYIKRGFSNLAINFGCTGGQHRSVYAAEAMTRHLKNKFNVNIDLEHIEQKIKETRRNNA